MSERNGRHDTDGASPAPVFVRRAAPVALVVLGLALYLPGVNWGLPGTTSWSQDTIAGLRTIGAVRGWPEVWSGRYPPLQYFLNAGLYAPVMHHWEREGHLVTDERTGLRLPAPPQGERVGLLLLMSRVLTAGMGCAAGIGLWMAARLLTRSEPAAFLAAAAMMIGADFTYFAHLGNVDVPSMCWFAWSAYFYARAIRNADGLNCAGLGFFAALAVCTKDGVAGAYPGMALGLIVAEALRREPGPGEAAPPRLLDPGHLRLVLQPKWIIGLAAFALPFLYINGLFHKSEPFLNRMRYWSAETETIHSMQYRYPDQLSLAWASVRYAASAVGWPMVAALAAATVHALRRHRALAAYVLLPAVSYYVIVIAWKLGFVYARFLLPPLALLGILLGVAVVDWLAWVRVPLSIRRLAPWVVALPTLGFAAHVDVAMLRDTRYEAEAWFVEHVPKGATVGIFCKPQYLPRVFDMGYPTALLAMREETFSRPVPEYLVLTSYDYEEYDEERAACQRALEGGRLGYEIVTTFARPAGSDPWAWLALGGTGVERPGKISPTLIVLQQSAAAAAVEPGSAGMAEGDGQP